MGLDDTIGAVLAIREALLRVPGLDAASEPVPLRLPDQVMLVLNLAVYLDGLLGRVARLLGVSRGEAADAAVGMLRPN
jgi:phosphatidylserine synthase